MNILVIHSELGVLRGGGENFTKNLFTAFAQRGHDVCATFIADSRGRYPIALPQEMKPLPLSGYWSRKLGQETLSNVARRIPPGTVLRAKWDRLQEAICWRTILWHDRRFSARVLKEFAQRWNEYDAVYVHGSAVLASHVAQYCPTILRLPGPVSVDLSPALKAVHVVCANGDALDQVRVFLGEHAIELPIGLDANTFKPGDSSLRRRLGWSDDHWVVGYVGRLAQIKGIDLLASAFCRVRRTTPNARLLIVGSGEEDTKIRAILSAEIKDGVAHIESDVPHKSLAEWYGTMDLFVMPSRYENYSNAVIEALACGVPFLVSGVGGNKRLAETEGGWFFTHNCSDSLAQAMNSIALNRKVTKDKGAIGGAKVRQDYSWVTSAKRLEDILWSCVRKRINADASS
jgi:glycosyltransferase involved in cell wall biosynthesis